MSKLVRTVVTAVLVVVATSALAHNADIDGLKIIEPWTRATPPNAKVGGGYLTLTNTGVRSDRLLDGSSEIAARVEVHKMEMKDGIMTMRPVPRGVPIQPGATVRLAPGGYHLMLMDLKRPIVEGEMIPVKLRFEQAGVVNVEFVAGPFGSTASAHQSQDDASAPTADE